MSNATTKRPGKNIQMDEFEKPEINQQQKRYSILTLDKEGVIKTWNKGVKALQGYDAHEIIGKHISIFYSNDDLELGVVDRNVNTAQSKGMAECVVCLVRKDSSFFWANINYIATYDSEYQLTGFLIITIEMHAPLKEGKLNISDAEIISPAAPVFDHTKNPCLIFDRNWNYVYVSRDAAALNGRKPEDLIGKNLWLEFPEKKNCPFYENFTGAVAENKEINFESYHPIWKKWFKGTLTPTANGLIVYLHDITAKKSEAFKFYQDNEQYRQIVETAQEGIWLIDANNLTIFVNRKMCEILEYSYEEMIGKENIYFMTDASKQKSAKAIERRKTGLIENIELELITKNGKLICTNLSANPIYDDNDAYNGALAMVTDITERKFLQQELVKEQEEKQREIAKAVEKAHEKERSEIGAELHDNVQQLLVSSNLLIKHGILNDGLNKDSIKKGLDYINIAIQELRKLSHVLVGPANNNIDGLFASVGGLIEDVTLLQDIQIDFRHNELQEHEIASDLKLVIFRIIQEQMSNILKYAFANKVIIEIIKESSVLTLIINDNGRGFDTMAKRKGIGLKNIKNRAKAYNGKMSIVSAPGKGVNMKIIFHLPPSPEKPKVKLLT